jgi:hypothetical protein
MRHSSFFMWRYSEWTEIGEPLVSGSKYTWVMSAPKMQKARTGFPALAFLGIEPALYEEVQMPNPKPWRFKVRRFLSIAKRVLSLVLLVLELIRQWIDLTK